MRPQLENSQLIAPLSLEITEKIAEGGMGIVYRANITGVGQFKRSVALKIIREEYGLIQEFRHNFEGEAQLAALLLHPNIVQTFQLGEWNQQLYMLMEFVDGLNLEDLLTGLRMYHRKLPVELAVHIAARISDALEFAHSRRRPNGAPLAVVHRDVNPRNILLSYEGQVKLTDFGIAKANNLMYNKEGEVIAGKSDYLSPEQALKQTTDGRADIFSTAVVLLEMLQGDNMFADDEAERSRDMILRAPLPDVSRTCSGADRQLNKVLQKALERDRNKRYSRAGAFADGLNSWLQSRASDFNGERMLAGFLAEWRDQAPSFHRRNAAIAVP